MNCLGSDPGLRRRIDTGPLLEGLGRSIPAWEKYGILVVDDSLSHLPRYLPGRGPEKQASEAWPTNQVW